AKRMRLPRRISLRMATATKPTTGSRVFLKPRLRASARRVRRGFIWRSFWNVTTSERNDDLAEHLAALQSRQAALEVGERHLGVDHRPHAGGHLGKALADVAHGRSEGADDAILLLEQLHQVERRRWA